MRLATLFRVNPRIFIASTTEDLSEHRAAARDAVNQPGCIPIIHEYWSANGRPTVQECRDRVRSCDALIVVVAHRYGWIPSAAQGGDDRQSITQIEVEEARRNGIPVFPFMLDSEAAWPNEEVDSPQLLKEFRKELETTCVRFFKSPEDLAFGSSVTLQEWLRSMWRQRFGAGLVALALIGGAAAATTNLVNPYPKPSPPTPRPPAATSEPSTQVVSLLELDEGPYQITLDRPLEDAAALQVDDCLFIPRRRPAGLVNLAVCDSPPIEGSKIQAEVLDKRKTREGFERASVQFEKRGRLTSLWAVLEEASRAKVEPTTYRHIYTDVALDLGQGINTCSYARLAQRWIAKALEIESDQQLLNLEAEVAAIAVLQCTE